MENYFKNPVFVFSKSLRNGNKDDWLRKMSFMYAGSKCNFTIQM